MPRLFFALQPADQQGAALLANLESRFAAQSIVAIPPGNVHATLCFLGEVEDARIPALCEAAAHVRGGEVSVSFDFLEYWAGPKIICATASPSGVVGADALSRAILDELTRAGFAPDVKPF